MERCRGIWAFLNEFRYFSGRGVKFLFYTLFTPWVVRFLGSKSFKYPRSVCSLDLGVPLCTKKMTPKLGFEPGLVQKCIFRAPSPNQLCYVPSYLSCAPKGLMIKKGTSADKRKKNVSLVQNKDGRHTRPTLPSLRPLYKRSGKRNSRMLQATPPPGAMVNFGSLGVLDAPLALWLLSVVLARLAKKNQLEMESGAKKDDKFG